MATLSDIYNKVKLGEDLADKGMATTAEYVANRPDLISSTSLDGLEQAVGATTSTNYNPVESGVSAASSFIRAAGGLPGLDQVANPIADSLDNLHTQGYQATQLSRQAKSDSFDEKNNAKYVSDLSNGRSVATASLAKLGREAVSYFSNSNAMDMVDDTAKAAGFLAGSYVLGGVIGKGIKGAYTGIASARLATTAEAKMAQYDSAIKLAESTRAQALERLGQANISNTERETLAQQVAELDNTIKTASQELNESIKSANLARNDLAAEEMRQAQYGDTFMGRSYEGADIPATQSVLDARVATAKDTVQNAVDDVVTNKHLLEQAQQEQGLIKDYLKADNKLNSFKILIVELEILCSSKYALTY